MDNTKDDIVDASLKEDNVDVAMELEQPNVNNTSTNNNTINNTTTTSSAGLQQKGAFLWLHFSNMIASIARLMVLIAALTLLFKLLPRLQSQSQYR